MASVSDDENVPLEETGRRTRSGRKVTAPTTPSGRTTRRSHRKHTTEQIPESSETVTEEKVESKESAAQSGIIQEMLAEAAQGLVSPSSGDNPKEDQQLESDDIFLVSQESNELPGGQTSDYVMATQEEGNDQNHTDYMSEVSDRYVPQTQELDEMFGTPKDPESEQDDIVVSTQQTEEIIITQAEDEKSSSFPFGDIQPSDNSDGKAEEVAVSNISDCVDSSLLASLVGDNANSLPSASEESQSKDIFEHSERKKTTKIKINLSEHSQSQPAIAEELPNGGDRDSEKTSIDADAEMVSEDELPVATKPKVTDAEEVSDDELPAPKAAELPADTEVVSEDELPASVKKRKASEGYDPSSPTDESTDMPEKKSKLTLEEKEESKERKKEKRKLPELDRYWSAVNEDPADFTGWTYLLQYVDQENDVDAARDAYDAFLSHYPYCYGYWRKYADYEKRKGNKKKCEEVFERGLKAIPLSVDLWIHYLTHVKTNNADNEDFVRSQFERALTACGLEFRSDKLWEAFVKWEMEGKRYSKVVKVYDRLLKTPTQGYSGHFDSFQDLVNNHPVATLISVEEFKKIRAEVRESEKPSDKDVATDEEEEEEADDHVKNDEEAAAIRDKIIAIRRKTHKSTVSAVTARWTFEEGIKRPYFHVKPLERCQLKNWNEYLDFEIERGDRKRVLILFERCLIACALYDEFWLKLIRYLESQNDPELIPVTRDAFDRACTIHHPDKPSLHMMWSAFEECQNNFDKAADILMNIEKVCPNLLQIAYRRINLERRRKDYSKCKELYEHYISQAKNKSIAGSLTIKYARFCHKIMNDLEAGLNVLQTALEKDSSNTRIALQMIDLALQRSKVDEEEVVSIMDKFMARDGMDPEQKVLFAQRKVEFLEDFGTNAKGLQDAQRSLQVALNKANEAKKKSESSPSKKTNTKESTPTTASTNTATYNNGNYGYGSSANSSYYGNSQAYQGYDSYGYNHWQYGSGYNSGYTQWSGYGNYY